MRVLFIHTYYRYRGGEDAVFENELQLLKRNGHEVDYLVFQNNHLTLFKFMMAPFNPYSYFKMRKKLKEFRPDVVHIHNFYFGASPAIIPAIKRGKYPLVHTLHNYRLLCPSGFLFANKKIFLQSLEDKFPWKAIRRGVYRNSILTTLWLTISVRFFNWIYGWDKIDRFIALNQDSKDKFLSSYLKLKEKQIAIKTNFVEDFQISRQERGPHFLYAGRLSEEKGIDILLGAFAKSKYKLVIIGDGPMRQDVEKAAAENPNINYLGFCKKDIVQAELQKCSCLLFPSIWFECAPMIIMEAFVCQTPVISSRIGAMQTLITHGVNGLHFEAGNSADLAEKINYWSNLPKEVKERFYTGTRSAYEEHYTPNASLEKLLSIYAEAIEETKTN